jgi:hypothetical protein
MSVTGPGDDIVVPPASVLPDYEGPSS